MGRDNRSAREPSEFVPGKGFTPVADLTREDCLLIAEHAREVAEAFSRVRVQGRESVEEIEERRREARLRRRAGRQGLSLQKSRSRTPRDPLWGTFMLVDADSNVIVAWGSQSGFGMSLDEVEAELDEEPDS